jgi:hypothetical protein
VVTFAGAHQRHGPGFYDVIEAVSITTTPQDSGSWGFPSVWTMKTLQLLERALYRQHTKLPRNNQLPQPMIMTKIRRSSKSS